MPALVAVVKLHGVRVWKWPATGLAHWNRHDLKHIGYSQTVSLRAVEGGFAVLCPTFSACLNAALLAVGLLAVAFVYVLAKACQWEFLETLPAQLPCFRNHIASPIYLRW